MAIHKPFKKKNCRDSRKPFYQQDTDVPANNGSAKTKYIHLFLTRCVTYVPERDMIMLVRMISWTRQFIWAIRKLKFEVSCHYRNLSFCRILQFVFNNLSANDFEKQLFWKMRWYGGSIVEAVNLSKKRNAIFVVYVEGMKYFFNLFTLFTFFSRRSRSILQFLCNHYAFR